MSLTSTWRAPCSASIRSTSAATSLGFQVVDLDRDPVPAGRVDQLGGLLDRLGPVHLRALLPVVRPVQYTVAPAAPSWTAMPRPAPRLAPATSATLPSSACLSMAVRDAGPMGSRPSSFPSGGKLAGGTVARGAGDGDRLGRAGGTLAPVGFYREHIVPRLADMTLNGRPFDCLRARVTADLGGEVLEIGFGSGRNLPALPGDGARACRAVEPSAVGRKLAAGRVAASPVPVEFVGLDGRGAAGGRRAASTTSSRPGRCARSPTSPAHCMRSDGCCSRAGRCTSSSTAGRPIPECHAGRTGSRRSSADWRVAVTSIVPWASWWPHRASCSSDWTIPGSRDREHSPTRTRAWPRSADTAQMTGVRVRCAE